MATRRIVPRGDLEGSVGSGEKRWEKAYIGNVGNVYDTVANMVADLELREGTTVETKGNININDGGAALYMIRTKTVDDVEDGKHIIFLTNGNVAEWISKNDYLSYKTVEYSETLNNNLFKSEDQAAYEWEQRKALDTAEGTITVATFNVYGLALSKAVLDYLSRFPLSKQLITMLMLKAQVISLNEIYTGENYDASQAYNAQNKFPYGVFTESYDTSLYQHLPQGYKWGTLTKSALEITSSVVAKFPDVSDWEGCSYSKIVVNVGGKTISVYSTHLEYRSSDAGQERRIAQHALLHGLAEADTSDYVIVMGDMNNTSFNEFDVWTNDGYKLVNTGQYKTWENTLPIDNIIVSPNITILDSGKINVTDVPNPYSPTIPKAVSDHSPIWARLRLD